MKSSNTKKQATAFDAQQEYHNSPIIKTVKLLLDASPDGQWKGTATELMIAGHGLLHIPIAPSAQATGYYLRSVSDEVLNEDGIGRYVSRNGNAGSIYHFFLLPRTEISCSKVQDTSLPTFRDKLAQKADRILSPFRSLNDHRPYILRHMEAAVAHRRFDVCIVQYLSSDVLIPMVECRYVIELPVGGSMDVAAEQVLAMLQGLGFTGIEQTMSNRKGYNMLTFRITW